MILKMPYMSIAFVCLPNKRPPSKLVLDWTWVFCKGVEKDAIYGNNNELLKIQQRLSYDMLPLQRRIAGVMNTK
jgi:hypothetical protein